MDRCVVLVDAGYLLGAAASLLAGDSSRGRLVVNYPELVVRIRERAEQVTGVPVLRLYWFDAAPNRIPLPEHRVLRVLPRVTVRLGVLTQTGGRPTQKGVDAAIHAVLSDLAQRKACSDVVVITGDGDLLPAVVAAKDHGVAFHVWAVQAADGEFNQSEDLIAEADEREVLDKDWINVSIVAAPHAVSHLQPGRSREEVAILAAPRSDIDLDTTRGDAEHLTAATPSALNSGSPCPLPGGSGAVASAEPHGHIPTPKEIAQLHPKHEVMPVAGGPNKPVGDSMLRWSSSQGVVDRSLPTLADVTERAQQWQDREEDITSVSGAPAEVGKVYARRWASRVTPEQLRELHAAYPRIPRQLDGELLRYAARFNLLSGQDDRIDQDARYQIRDGFWREIEGRDLAGRASAEPPPLVPSST